MPKIVLSFIISVFVAQTASGTSLPNSKQTVLGLYLTATETDEFLEATPSALFIDVRTPQEVDKTGLAAGIDAFIPLTLANNSGKS